jgi:hypothetical protein
VTIKEMNDTTQWKVDGCIAERPKFLIGRRTPINIKNKIKNKKTKKKMKKRKKERVGAGREGGSSLLLFSKLFYELGRAERHYYYYYYHLL